MTKDKWLLIRDYVFAWTLALIVYNLVRSVGTIEIDGIQLSTQQGLLVSPFFGMLFGVVFGFAQMTFERLYDKRTALPKLFLLRLLLSLVVLLLATIAAFITFIFLLEMGDLKFSEFIFNPPIFVFYGYILLIDILISLLRQVSLMLGPGTLKKLFLGQFYQPREEERVFMFLDLKSSTEMAEKLGHFKYSRMIQDCFDDLAVVTKTEAEIYQYVGDEAVLTWHKGPGLKDKNCIHAFYRFKAQINTREDHYLKAYGHKPFFKAGLNIGKVTVAEVGKVKKEIAYHGDTINTAARIQGKCNDFNSELLISKELKDALGEDFDFETNHMGHIPLKGKANEVSIFSVEEKP
ncbi:adenylate/guanylate cyclase domain-containing protein [Roseivirga sp. E12]|uniref:adenylate/guanylate cyclase domain-containing protein n=1 Tax=Roseivirga sp. E12 TaxID=2819237 RepID=UPI001ABC3CF6|nr:adenylate/guanylate cyclase domain-containing protein [Roseivirga sp. E12]MBO3697816.1 adenylate/guanylate cyclase domain-containing protein [Roseivirga sp. E12]